MRHAYGDCVDIQNCMHICDKENTTSHRDIALVNIISQNILTVLPGQTSGMKERVSVFAGISSKF